MNIDMASLFPDLEGLTPDSRWNMLQEWLKDNPEYGDRVKRWSTQSVESVYFEVSAMIVKRYGPLATIALGIPAIKAKLTQTIETLQTCYRERNQTEKEINDVNHINTKPRSIRAGVKRSRKGRKPKRASEDRD